MVIHVLVQHTVLAFEIFLDARRIGDDANPPQLVAAWYSPSREKRA